MQRLVPAKDTVVSGLCESFISNGMREDSTSGNCPISFAGVAVPVSHPFGHSKLYQVLYPCSWEFPLFPDIHPETPAQPFIPTSHCIAHTCYSEIAKPSSDEYFHIVSTIPAAKRLAQIGGNTEQTFIYPIYIGLILLAGLVVGCTSLIISEIRSNNHKD